MKQIVAKGGNLGSGTSTEVQDPHEDSWALKQIREGQVIPGIKVEQGLETIRFASRINRIACAAGNFTFSRTFHRKKDGCIAFFYSIKGSFEHSTVKQLDLLKEMLYNQFSDDYQTYFFESEPFLKRTLETKVSFQYSTIYLYFEIKFGKDFLPPESFVEV